MTTCARSYTLLTSPVYCLNMAQENGYSFFWERSFFSKNVLLYDVLLGKNLDSFFPFSVDPFQIQILEQPLLFPKQILKVWQLKWQVFPFTLRTCIPFCYRLIINDDLDQGSQLPYIKWGRENGYAVLVANTNVNSVEVTSKNKKKKDPVKIRVSTL